VDRLDVGIVGPGGIELPRLQQRIGGPDLREVARRLPAHVIAFCNWLTCPAYFYFDNT